MNTGQLGQPCNVCRNSVYGSRPTIELSSLTDSDEEQNREHLMQDPWRRVTGPYREVMRISDKAEDENLSGLIV
jgi:hypothetical protein